MRYENSKCRHSIRFPYNARPVLPAPVAELQIARRNTYFINARNVVVATSHQGSSVRVPQFRGKVADAEDFQRRPPGGAAKNELVFSFTLPGGLSIFTIQFAASLCRPRVRSSGTNTPRRRGTPNEIHLETNFSSSGEQFIPFTAFKLPLTASSASFLFEPLRVETSDRWKYPVNFHSPEN